MNILNFKTIIFIAFLSLSYQLELKKAISNNKIAQKNAELVFLYEGHGDIKYIKKDGTLKYNSDRRPPWEKDIKYEFSSGEYAEPGDVIQIKIWEDWEMRSFKMIVPKFIGSVDAKDKNGRVYKLYSNIDNVTCEDTKRCGFSFHGADNEKKLVRIGEPFLSNLGEFSKAQVVERYIYACMFCKWTIPDYEPVFPKWPFPSRNE